MSNTSANDEALPSSSTHEEGMNVNQVNDNLGAEHEVGQIGRSTSRSTTAVSAVSVSAGSSGGADTMPSHSHLNPEDYIEPPPRKDTPTEALPSRALSAARTSRSRAPDSRKPSNTRYGNASPGSDRSASVSRDSGEGESKKAPLGIIGICALDSKARSKPSRNILNIINAKQEFEVIIFGDKIILDEEPENWPICDYLISFFSEGFPLQKAIAYVRLRKPFSVNDLPMQMVLWDRRMCLKILDHFEVATPKRLEISRDGGPRLDSAEMCQHVQNRTGVQIPGPDPDVYPSQAPPNQVVMLDDDTLCVDGNTLKKPFVEKPVSGEDHNIFIYYSKDVGGGGRRLFRKINNKSSELDNDLLTPRSITDPHSSYVYESFLSTQNHEDVKVYTVGPDYGHAETRKSPVVDGIVKRNTHGKEMRYVTSLKPDEAIMASKISKAFGQRICGFDLLRVGSKSFVIDVNGWSFVKNNNDYYDRCASILKSLFVDEKTRKERKVSSMDGEGPTAPDAPEKTSLSHRSTFKAMLKSPSMPRIAAFHHHNQRTHRPASPEILSQTAPMSSASSIEKTPGLDMGRFPVPQTEALPPPILTGPSPVDGSGPALTKKQVAESDNPTPMPAAKAQWKLKGMVAVIRHADRTPKQKWKFTFHTRPFVDLLKGHREEVLLVGDAALSSVMNAVSAAMKEGVEDMERLRLLRTSLLKKGGWPGTKVQIKPMFRKKRSESTIAEENDNEAQETKPKPVEQAQGVDLSQSRHNDQAPPFASHQKRQASLTSVTLSREVAAEDNLEIDKLQLIMKWGGEPTHSARYQSQELGENFRNDLLLMNRDAMDDLTVYSSSERRVTTSAQLWTAAFLNKQEVPPDAVLIRKDLLDDSNAAKDEMDKVKKKLKGLLRKGNKAPSQFAWPENMPEPYIIAGRVVELMMFHRRVMRENFASLYGGARSSLAAAVKPSRSRTSSPGRGPALSQAQAVSNVQNRWCCGEDAELFKERWEKLFDEFCDAEKVDPGKISELHDTMKFDALHNRQFLEWVFTPSDRVLEEFVGSESKTKMTNDDQSLPASPSKKDFSPPRHTNSDKPPSEKSGKPHRMGFRRQSEIDPAFLRKSANDPATESYFNLFTGNTRSKAKTDARLEKLRELFLYSKILFDFIGPQEYGITDSEKLEIGLLTSLPLLRAIVNDLEDMQASEGAKTSVYFTKESHIYTLLNCIIEGGIQTKIERNKIPELDYLSTICFELFESHNPTQDNETESFNYSIRIAISPGCHTFEPLDVQLDSRHCIGFAQRRSLTAHNEYKGVIETLRAKFHTVKLPKSFVAVNLSEKVPQAFEDSTVDNGLEKVTAEELEQANVSESIPRA
ncbi:MAG: hypothetical protein M1828_001854 [Chrysothrix sp. TS-e1954]|nr:MAG: hypothetical protein M1828_001854 [Chrysothrix sp. TS-e1954]